MSIAPESGLCQRLRQSGVIAVTVIDDLNRAVPLARALLRGGVDVIELTLRTAPALQAMEQIRSQVPGMLVGAGTVLNKGQVDAIARRASFAVSPGVNPEVIRYAARFNLPLAPGVMTPTDVDQSLCHGCRLMKYFPASTAGGLEHLKNIATPFRHLGIGFIPLGGVTEQNLREYLDSELVTAVGGSWLAPGDLVQAGDWDEISQRAENARKIVDGMNR